MAAGRDNLSDRLKNDPKADTDLIRRCYRFAADRHGDQKRRSGEPYVVHPLGVATTIAELPLDVASICAGLLHDCLEDTSASPEDLSAQFGQEITVLVEGVTKLGKIPWHSREERQAENFRKMLLAMARDIRVILIKLSDRLDNMRTLEHMPREKQERIARETREIYAPMAHRLGIQWMKAELEDLCFEYLEPEEFRGLKDKMAETEASRDAYFKDVCDRLATVANEAGVKARISGRAKHLWSIFMKIRRTGRELEQIYDIAAFRLIVSDVRDCYAALGIVHANWTPVPGRFKDYIALPKPNMYQSLHTTVIGPRAERIEIQIRTQDMHRVAEQGVAAHFQYKEAANRGENASFKEHRSFAWLNQLMEWQKALKDPTEFIETVKIDLFEEEVFVFTPKGDVKALPKGSTPVDFAFAVHSQVGAHCSGARVNGLIVPLRYRLRNGDTVDILTSPHQKPAKDWLKFAVTSKARTAIRQFVRAKQRERSQQYGRDLLGKELRSRRRSLSQAERDDLLTAAASKLRAASAEDLLVLIGYGKISPKLAAETIYPSPAEPDKDGEAAASRPAPIGLPPKRPIKRSVGGVRVEGEADIVVRFAKCCEAIPGDSIVGFVSRGRGVTIHRIDCKRTLDLDPARKVQVAWEAEAQLSRSVTVEVISNNAPGILAAISKVFTEHGVNIVQAKCRSEDERGVNTFAVMVGSTDQLGVVLRSVARLGGVVAARRL